MTTAPDAITQAEELRQPWGLALSNSDLDRLYNDSKYDIAPVGSEVRQLVAEVRHRRLATHGAGEGLREALRQIANNNWKDTSRCRFVARQALATDAGSTTREGGEGVLRATLRRAHAHIAAMVAPDDRDGLTRRLLADCSAALATTSSPDASPASLSRGEAIRFYKLPFTLHEPKGDGAAYIRDADGGAVAMLMWPGHSLEDTDAATEETYRIGRAMAAALPSPEAPANRQEAGE